jgi:hypothetical protein
MIDRVSARNDPIVRGNLIGTAMFTVSAVIAAVVFNGPVRAVGVVVALVLFAVGIFAFIWSYITAVQRSRTDEIAVAQLYFLAGGSTPKHFKRMMLGALTVQIVVALSTAIARNRTDGRAGSTLAFGILVPMFGIGLNGLWCSRNGSFAARPARIEQNDEPDGESEVESNSDSVPTFDNEMEQNSPHG